MCSRPADNKYQAMFKSNWAKICYEEENNLIGCRNMDK
jgi:hypothetical protein